MKYPAVFFFLRHNDYLSVCAFHDMDVCCDCCYHVPYQCSMDHCHFRGIELKVLVTRGLGQFPDVAAHSCVDGDVLSIDNTLCPKFWLPLEPAVAAGSFYSDDVHFLLMWVV